MAQNVTIAGASYSDVPSIVVPKTGSGTASFFDVSDTTAVAADVLSSKYFYTAAGSKTQGSITSRSDSGTTTLNATTTSKTYSAGYYANAHGCSVSVYDGSVT